MNKIKMAFIVVVLMLIVAGVTFFVFSCRAKQEAKDRASLYTIVQGGAVSSLVIDGRVDEGEWDGFKRYQVGEKNSGTTVYLATDEQNLYVAIESKGNITDDAIRDHAILSFIPNKILKVEAGKFKTLKIRGNGTILWEAWDRVEKLPVKYVHKTEDYSKDIAKRLEPDQAVRVYSGSKMANVDDEKGVYAVFAQNITQVPDGLICKTSFNGYRSYEAKIPLSLLGVAPGQTMRIFGLVHNASALPQDIHYPNSLTKFFTSPPLSMEITPAGK